MSTNLELFHKTCLDCSKLTTNAYSSSFSLGINVLDKKFHEGIYAIYGFVRFADEIVDTFHEHDKKKLLEEFKSATFQAIQDKISLNPILNSFQWVVNKYNIEDQLINAFLKSMAMDLERKDYDDKGYREYIYGSAEVVGLMCLRVFCEGDNELYLSLKSPACSLGAAFQKVNFLRDLKADFEGMGRTYFPEISFQNLSKEELETKGKEIFSEAKKQEIEADIAKDFDDALDGIQKLPTGSRFGVYLAYSLYLKLFRKIKKTPASDILRRRIRISDAGKCLILMQCWGKI